MAAWHTWPEHRSRGNEQWWNGEWNAGHQGQQWRANLGNNAGGVDGQAQGQDAIARIDEATQQVAVAQGQAAVADASARDQQALAAQGWAADADARGRDEQVPPRPTRPSPPPIPPPQKVSPQSRPQAFWTSLLFLLLC